MHCPNPVTEQEKLDFFLVSAHELRTSLTAMKWLFKMLLDGDFGNLSETQEAMLKQAAASNERMIALINDTMAVIKADEMKIPYASEPLSLSSLTEESIKDFTSEAAARDMHIRYTPAPSPVVVLGDTEKLRIVMHNLIENAIKYGTQGTDISISLRVEDGSALLAVANRGVVIPEEEQEHIFEKFFRASNTRNDFPGVGLGLYATKHIVERHGGDLTFVSTPHTGTIFTLRLPLG